MSVSTSSITHASVSDLSEIIQLLKGIMDVQSRHTTLLKQVVEAATRPVTGKSSVATALEALVAATNGQTSAMTAVMETMQGLPDQISTDRKSVV